MQPGPKMFIPTSFPVSIRKRFPREKTMLPFRLTLANGAPDLFLLLEYGLSVYIGHVYLGLLLPKGRIMGPEQGRTQHQHFRVHHHQQSLISSPHHYYPHSCPLLYQRPFLPYVHGMHEAIHREIEKERIREEIIMSEIIRRREIEAEVRRELMMENELALWRGRDGLPLASTSVTGFDSSRLRLRVGESRGERRSLEERNLLLLGDRERLNVRRESGEVEPLPFQRGTAEARISEVKPLLEGPKEKEKIILLAKPTENISGVKREASGSAASESPSESNSRKKAKKEWSCATCQVSTTSEQALNEHIQGKKHKLKADGLRAPMGGKNYTIGLFPKKAAIATIVDVPSDNEVKVAPQSLPSEDKTGEASSKMDDLPASTKLKKNKKTVVAMPKDSNHLKKKFRFWCEVCQIGCHSPNVFNTHLEGKKHKRRVNMNGQLCPSDEKKDAVDENFADDGGAEVGPGPVEGKIMVKYDGPMEEEAVALVDEPVDHDHNSTKVDVGGKQPVS